VPQPPTTHAAPASFSDLGLDARSAALAADAGWAVPSAVQAATIPAVLQGRDVLGLAPTGSGKTAAYLLPLLQRLQAEPGVLEARPRRLRLLMLVPTRELAAQVADVAAQLAPALKAVVAVGGLSINPQMMALRGGAHLVVATPGRLLDLLDHNALTLSDLHTLVLDEADRLLDLGFADELARVLAAVPAERQTLLFSATMPARLALLAARVLRQGVLRTDVRGVAEATPALIRQRAISVDTAQRTPLLRHLLHTERWPRALVFTATQYAAEHVADKLRHAGIAAAALHGRQSNQKRTQALDDLERGAINVLVATDLAARGIDIPALEVVVNHDLPRSPADHVHRIGRTGRAGNPGLAISFVCPDTLGSEDHFRLIEKRQQQRVPRETVAGFEPKAPPAERVVAPGSDPNGGIKGKRPNKKDKARALAAAAAPANATPGKIRSA
jgi:superfamily II DNA/RNA helicase